jgi:glycosyltransferase involved in cell wall biosynthesis
VIPAFNAEEFLDRTIRSVLAQTYESFELIVVNDGSHDQTAEIANSFLDSRIRVLSQDNMGVAAARNRGLEMSSGKWIAFLDADDHWGPDKLEVQIRAMSEVANCTAVGCLMRYESSAGRKLGLAGKEVGEAEQDLIQRGRLMPFPLSSILFLKAAVSNVGGFDETLDRSVPGQVEDLDLLARVAMQGPVTTAPFELGGYTIHAKSASSRHLSSQQVGARFVQARLHAKSQGSQLNWNEFRLTYRPTLRERYADRIQAWYRQTGQSVADGDWLRALLTGALAFVFGPRYTTRRFKRQHPFDK